MSRRDTIIAFLIGVLAEIVVLGIGISSMHWGFPHFGAFVMLAAIIFPIFQFFNWKVMGWFKAFYTGAACFGLLIALAALFLSLGDPELWKNVEPDLFP